ncbi:phenylalanyl-tRNA synthetase alpha subunit [marine actinobacterium PHSC20C1]|nr:phenylalanyl-tRNA synthetase alpha subunit [marine actinobacterium PHSC20C1]
MKKLSASAVIAFIVAGSILGAAPAHAVSAPVCSISVGSKISAAGKLTFYPSAKCDKATKTIIISNWSPTGTSPIKYHLNKPAGTYAGNSVTMTSSKPGKYCILVTVDWSYGPFEMVSKKVCRVR